MALPNKIKVGPFSFKVNHIDGLRNVDDVRLHGRHDSVFKIIDIEKKQCEQMKKETLIHECLHAMIDVAGLDFKGLEEAYVTAMSPIIFGWIQDNPKTVKWIMDDKS